MPKNRLIYGFFSNFALERSQKHREALCLHEKPAWLFTIKAQYNHARRKELFEKQLRALSGPKQPIPRIPQRRIQTG